MSTEKKILSEAITIFRQNGYHSTSMNMISEACHISKGNLTYHYPTKEILYKKCIEASDYYFKKYVLYDSFENRNELDGLINFLKNVKTWLYFDGKVIGCIFSNTALELRHSNSELADIPLECLRSYKMALKDKIKSGQSNGSIVSRESAEVMTEDLFMGYEGAMIYSRIENSLTCFDLFIERTQRYFQNRSHLKNRLV